MRVGIDFLLEMFSQSRSRNTDIAHRAIEARKFWSSANLGEIREKGQRIVIGIPQSVIDKVRRG